MHGSHDDRSSGLEGVVAADTQISHVDGERGQLVIAGFDVEQLAQPRLRAGRRSACCAAPAAPRSIALALGTAPRRPRGSCFRGSATRSTHADGMDALRAGLAHLRSTR